jgi:hypothetical protein
MKKQEITNEKDDSPFCKLPFQVKRGHGTVVVNQRSQSTHTPLILFAKD